MPENPNLERIENDLGRWLGERPSTASLVLLECIARALVEIARTLDHIDKTNLNVDVRQ